MIDFHSHILPGMDDGSKSVEESEAMLRMLAEQGVKTVVATPHFYANHESVSEFLTRREKAYGALEKVLGGDLPGVLLGAEVKFYPGIGNMQGLRELCIQGSEVLLLEMPFARWSAYTVKEVVDMSCSGRLTVALAHIDRYLCFQDSAVWRQLLENEILMQANASFFTGFASRPKAMKMLRTGMIHMLGSDCHNLTDRPPNFGDAVARIKRKLGDEFEQYYTELGDNILV